MKNDYAPQFRREYTDGYIQAVPVDQVPWFVRVLLTTAGVFGAISVGATVVAWLFGPLVRQ